MTASPETGPVVLLYGCAECNWIYSPQTPEETTKKYLLMAQFKFEQHVCSSDCTKDRRRAGTFGWQGVPIFITILVNRNFGSKCCDCIDLCESHAETCGIC